MEDCLGFNGTLENRERSRKAKVSSCLPENTTSARSLRQTDADVVPMTAQMKKKFIKISVSHRLKVQKRALKACRGLNLKLTVQKGALYSACIEAAGLISAGVIKKLLGIEVTTEKAEKTINRVMDKLNAAIKMAES